MSFVVPPTPSYEEASDVMARLEQVSQRGSSENPEQPTARLSRALLALSCVTLTIGVLLLACAIVVMCAPRSLPGRLVFLICGTLM